MQKIYGFDCLYITPSAPHCVIKEAFEEPGLMIRIKNDNAGTNETVLCFALEAAHWVIVYDKGT